MIYSLFTEIAPVNKKMRPSAQSKSGLGRFDPDHIVELDWLCKPVVALGATTKSHNSGLDPKGPDHSAVFV